MAFSPIVAFCTASEIAYFSHHDVIGGSGDCKNLEIMRKTEQMKNIDPIASSVALKPLKSILRTPRYSTYTSIRHSNKKSTKRSCPPLDANNKSSGPFQKHPSAPHNQQRRQKKAASHPTSYRLPGHSLSRINKLTEQSNQKYSSHSNHNKWTQYQDQLSDLNRSFANFRKRLSTNSAQSVMIVSPLLHSEGLDYSKINQICQNTGLETAFPTVFERETKVATSAVTSPDRDNHAPKIAASIFPFDAPTAERNHTDVSRYFGAHMNTSIEAMKNPHLPETNDQTAALFAQYTSASLHAQNEYLARRLIPNGDALRVSTANSRPFEIDQDLTHHSVSHLTIQETPMNDQNILTLLSQLACICQSHVPIAPRPNTKRTQLRTDNHSAPLIQLAQANSLREIHLCLHPTLEYTKILVTLSGFPQQEDLSNNRSEVSQCQCQNIPNFTSNSNIIVPVPRNNIATMSAALPMSSLLHEKTERKVLNKHESQTDQVALPHTIVPSVLPTLKSFAKMPLQSENIKPNRHKSTQTVPTYSNAIHDDILSKHTTSQILWAVLAVTTFLQVPAPRLFHSDAFAVPYPNPVLPFPPKPGGGAELFGVTLPHEPFNVVSSANRADG